MLHFIVLQEVGGKLTVILGVAAIDKEVVEVGVQVTVQLLHIVGGGRGRADDIGIVLLVVLFQIGQLGHPWVVGLVITVPV